MAVPSLDVAIVGAGTAGAASALFLARAGHRVTLFEAVATPGPVGAGIMMQMSGLSVLAELGLLPGVLQRGTRLTSLRCVTSRRKPVLSLAYQRLHPSAFGIGLHRGVLFDALYDAARAEPGVELRAGVPIDSMQRVAERWRLLTHESVPLGDFDLVVVANGARSTLRAQSGLERRARAYPWGALWCILEDPAQLFGAELFQVVSGTRRMLGFLPSGMGPSGNTPLVSLFWSVRADQVTDVLAGGAPAWKRAVTQLEPRAAPLLEQVQDLQQLIFARYHDVVMKPWHREDGVVFIGDAAHAMSPQLGQGANLALVDAAELAHALASTADLASALNQYSRARRSELAYYQWATRFLTPFFQSELPPLAWLRDSFMHLACSLPGTSSKMLRTLCGIERGVLLSAPKALPRLLSR